MSCVIDRFRQKRVGYLYQRLCVGYGVLTIKDGLELSGAFDDELDHN
jgi:hypothetical protein